MKAIILAAGYATRLYPLTIDTPKPLLKIAHQTIIEYMLDDLQNMPALDEVYIVTNEKFTPVFEKWASEREGANHPYTFSIDIVNDGTASNETRLGAIADVQFVIDRKAIADDLLVAAGDNIFRFDFANLAAFFEQKRSDVILAQQLNDPERLKTRGVVSFDDNQKVTSFQEKPAEPASNYVCPALYIHPQHTIHLYQDYLLEKNNPDAPGHFIQWLFPRVPVYAFPLLRPAIDIGTLETYKRVCNEIVVKPLSASK